MSWWNGLSRCVAKHLFSKYLWEFEHTLCSNKKLPAVLFIQGFENRASDMCALGAGKQWTFGHHAVVVTVHFRDPAYSVTANGWCLAGQEQFDPLHCQGT